MYRQAAASLQAGVGESHPAYRAVRENLAEVYTKLGRNSEARSIRRGTRSVRPEPQIPAGYAADRRADEPR
jgi:hypothetical protein